MSARLNKVDYRSHDFDPDYVLKPRLIGILHAVILEDALKDLCQDGLNYTPASGTYLVYIYEGITPSRRIFERRTLLRKIRKEIHDGHKLMLLDEKTLRCVLEQVFKENDHASFNQYLRRFWVVWPDDGLDDLHPYIEEIDRRGLTFGHGKWTKENPLLVAAAISTEATRQVHRNPE